MNETRDWPLQLKLNSAACDLAKSIYYAHGIVYGAGSSWEDLSPILHSNYVLIASRVLEDLAPYPRAIEWCIHCKSRDQSKYWKPYCSTYCADAATSKAVR